MLPTKFRFMQPSGFRGDECFQKSTNQKQELHVATMFINGSELNEQSLQRTFQRFFLPNLNSFGQMVTEEKILFQKSTNQKQELAVANMFDNGSGRNNQSLQRTFQGCFLPSFRSFGKVASKEKIFFQKLTNQKQEFPVAVMFANRSGRNEQSLQRTFQRCLLPNLDSFGQVVTEEKIFFQKSTNQKHELSVAAMFDNGSGRNKQSLQRICH